MLNTEFVCFLLIPRGQTGFWMSHRSKAWNTTMRTYTGSWPWGRGDVDVLRVPMGEQDPQARCLQCLEGGLLGSVISNMVSGIHVPQWVLALDAVQHSSPHPSAMQMTPVSWIRGERECAFSSVLEAEELPLVRCSYSPQVKSYAERSLSALSCAAALGRATHTKGEAVPLSLYGAPGLHICCNLSAGLASHKDTLIHVWLFVSGETVKLLFCHLSNFTPDPQLQLSSLWFFSFLD